MKYSTQTTFSFNAQCIAQASYVALLIFSLFVTHRSSVEATQERPQGEEHEASLAKLHESLIELEASIATLKARTEQRL